jgi:hypothetical protein
MAIEKPYTCPTCGAEFPTRTELEEHGRVQHPEMVQKKSQSGTPSSGLGEKSQE